MLLHEFKFYENSKPSMHELSLFKARFESKLDDHFLHFLEHQNGGVPSPNLISRDEILKYPIIVFWGLNSSKSNIVSVYEELLKDIGTTRFLPIAYDMAMRYICICLSTKESAVYVVSIDRMYYKSPTTIQKVFDSFSDFVNSLSQPLEQELEFEILAQLPWPDLEPVIAKNPKYFLGPPSDELSLLCQTIRFQNLAAFEGLLNAGADVTDAMYIAVLNNKIEFVKKLLEFGVLASNGLEYAVGPDRKELRDLLEKQL